MKNKFLSFRYFSKKFVTKNELSTLKDKKGFKGLENILQEEINFEKVNYISYSH